MTKKTVITQQSSTIQMIVGDKENKLFLNRNHQSDRRFLCSTLWDNLSSRLFDPLPLRTIFCI